MSQILLTKRNETSTSIEYILETTKAVFENIDLVHRLSGVK